MTTTPRWQTNCTASCCRFLGYFKNLDLYACPSPYSMPPNGLIFTVNKNGNYVHSTTFVEIEQRKTTAAAILEAYRLYKESLGIKEPDFNLNVTLYLV